MTPKNRTLEGKNRTLGRMVGQKSSGHYLWMILRLTFFSILSKGTYINDVRRFLMIFDPPYPLTSDFYLLMSDFFRSF